jgi:hypothetical protein
MATGDNFFGTIDLQTGVFTQIGTTSVTLVNMVNINGTLFGTDFDGQLYTVDPFTGGLTTVGNASLVPYFDFGAAGSSLYAIDDSLGNLYSIDSTTGAAASKGTTGFVESFADWSNLSSGSSTLYFANGSAIYTIDTADGSPTFIGDTGGVHIGALVFVNGKLYGGVNPSEEECGDCECSDCTCAGQACGGQSPGLSVVTIDTTTGVATLVAAVTGTTSPFFSLAADVAATPEPSTLGCMLAAAGALGWTRRRRS